jgi:Na+/glutamate symporter
VAHEFAVRLALIAFATAAIQGLANRADFEAALKLALAAAAACYVLGWLCGELARRVVEESVRRTAVAPAPVPTPTSAS